MRTTANFSLTVIGEKVEYKFLREERLILKMCVCLTGMLRINILNYTKKIVPKETKSIKIANP